MPKNQRQKLLMVFVSLLITFLIVVLILAALGPQIGSAFSNVSFSLNGGGGNGSPVNTNTPASIAQPTTTATVLGIMATPEPDTTEVAIRATELPMTALATVGDDVEIMPTTLPTMTAGGGGLQSLPTFPQTISTQPPTQVADVATEDIAEDSAESTVVAFSNVSIVDVSGDVIGDGTLKVYYPERVDFPNSARVELELNFDNRYITPTPFGQRTAIAVTQVTSTPRPGQPTPTEREPVYAVSGVQFNQLMGASLICLETQFDGCDDEPDTDDVQLISLGGRTWSWTIRPLEEISGYQNLSIQLWKVQRVNDREVAETIWNYGFTILVNEAPASIPVLWLIIGGGALGVASIFAYAGWRNWRKRVQASKPRPKAFISYRRSTSWAAARTIHDRLTEFGADVFIDVEDINDGRFAGVITNAIERSDFFILILSPGSLESEWVIKEAHHALEHDKRIIPVLVDGFDLYSGDLPEELQEITAHNAIKLTPEFFNAGIERIAKFMDLSVN